jgi:hypothetical protein
LNQKFNPVEIPKRFRQLRKCSSLVEVLAWQANPLLDFLRAVFVPSHTAGDRVRRRLSLTETLASPETGDAGCTVGFRLGKNGSRQGSDVVSPTRRMAGVAAAAN